MKTKIIFTAFVCLVILSCSKTQADKQKKDEQTALLVGLAFLSANSTGGCTTIGSSTATTNSDSTIKNITIPVTTTQLCSVDCRGSICAMQLTFSTAGTYKITLTQAKETRTCGVTVHTQTIDTSYGAFASTPYTLTSPTSTTTSSPIDVTETVAAGAVRGVTGATTSSYPSGTCSGSFRYSGTTSYSVLITKTN